MKILDRYVIRETIAPLLLALGLFTFLLAVKPMLEASQTLLAKGVSLQMVGFLLLTLLPQALGITIPMAFMAGLLMALGRLSGDREAVAMLACGISPMRLLRPVLALALVAGGLNMYCLIKLVPDANQRFRIETYKLLVQQSESDIKPGLFYEGFPGKVLFVRESKPGGGWTGVVLADTSQPGRPVVTLADNGYLDLDPAKQQVSIVLPGTSVRYTPGEETGVYDVSRNQDVRMSVPASSVFGDGNSLQRGRAEMTYSDLQAEEARKRTVGLSPHNEIMQRHQMFAFPVACLVFALVGLALGLHTRKEGKLGGFTLGIGVIAVYYAVFALAEARTKGGSLPAEWARWLPNIVVGIIGVLAVWWRSRTSGGDFAISIPTWLRWRRSAEDLTDAPAQKHVAVVIRIPHFDLPRPRLLDLYVGGKYLRIVTLAFFGLLVLYYIGTFIDKSEKLFKGQADGRMLLDYFYYATPQFVVHVVPMAILVAVLATIGGLTRTGELVVMRSCGVSLYRASIPLFVLGLVWSGGLFLLDDRVLAHANKKAEALDDVIRGGAPHTINTLANANWLSDGKGRIYYYTAFDTTRVTIFDLTVFETAAKPFRLKSHTEARRVSFVKDKWTATDGWIQTFPASSTTTNRSTREPFKTKTLDLVTPKQLSGMHNTEAALMTFGELRQHISQLATTGVSVAESQVNLQSRVAFPMVTMVMTLLGVPFGVTIGRRGALYGIGLAIILAASYWLLTTFFTAVGQAALLPPVLAAWAANILFLAVAAYMTLTVRT